MQARTIAQRVVTVLVAAALLALSSGMAWAAVSDYQEASFIPEGVSVNGVGLGGMTETEAREAIEDAVSAPLLRPVPVTADGKTYTFDPKGTVSVDVDAMVEQAFAPRRSASIITRARHDLLGTPIAAEVDPVYSVDKKKVTKWVSGVADKIDRSASDATATVSGSRIVITPSAEGRKTSVKKGTAALAKVFSKEQALSEANRAVRVPVKKIKPTVTEKRFEKTLLVDLSERRIRLFVNGELEKTYPCAVGTPGYPTPTGKYEIVLKRYLPTWVNPGSDWGKDMPASIPPGPGNPLGTRALNIDAPGIRFHGTENIASVGTAASHGCMRMYRSDIEDLYERVDVGNKVFIVP